MGFFVLILPSRCKPLLSIQKYCRNPSSGWRCVYVPFWKKKNKNQFLIFSPTRTVCDPGYYGSYCSRQCECHPSAECDPVSGQCRCPAGRTGPECKQTCPMGFFGANCLDVCDCANLSMCNAKTGKCECPPGFNGQHCEQGSHLWL